MVKMRGQKKHTDVFSFKILDKESTFPTAVGKKTSHNGES